MPLFTKPFLLCFPTFSLPRLLKYSNFGIHVQLHATGIVREDSDDERGLFEDLPAETMDAVHLHVHCTLYTPEGLSKRCYLAFSVCVCVCEES